MIRVAQEGAPLRSLVRQVHYRVTYEVSECSREDGIAQLQHFRIWNASVQMEEQTSLH
jgi:hypothetical protein